MDVELNVSGPLRLLDGKFSLEAHAKHKFRLEIPAVDILQAVSAGTEIPNY